MGVIADTDIPDWMQPLHPAIVPTFRSVGISAILHCGDVSIPSVLEELSQVAPA